MRPGDYGQAVVHLQGALIERGYALPRFGADGDFGYETVLGLRRFAEDHGLPWDSESEVSAALIAALVPEAPAVDVIAPGSDVLDLEGVALFDLRDQQRDPHPKSKTDKRGKTVRRPPATIDAIVLHQTGIEFPGTGEKLARRSLRVACHALAFREGFVAWSADPTWYLYHADRLNARSLGLEVDGNYPGLVGGKVGSGSASSLTDEVVAAARMGIKLLVEEGRRAGCPIKYIFAHRQTDAWRRADPGQGLWQRVVLEYAVPKLQLVPQQGETFSHPTGSSRRGMPVPIDWDPEGVGKY